MAVFKKQYRLGVFACGATLFTCLIWAPAYATSVFINEIHYDNTGTDTGEAVEVTGPAGTDLTGWSLVLYNGANGTVYDTDTLADVIPNQQNGFGTVVITYASNGLQNGAPDGLALVDATNTVIQFLSYEGSFLAVGGAANGMTSTDIGVSESGSDPIGFSLQLTGTGTAYGDFTWATAMANTFGSVNTGQTFTGGGQQPIPEPSTLLLLGSGLTGLSLWRWKHTHHHS